MKILIMLCRSTKKLQIILLIIKKDVPLHSLLKHNDPLAQLVEHNTFNVGVLGSSPKRITEGSSLDDPFSCP